MKKNKNKLLKLLQKKVTKKERGLKQKTFKLKLMIFFKQLKLLLNRKN